MPEASRLHLVTGTPALDPDQSLAGTTPRASGARTPIAPATASATPATSGSAPATASAAPSASSPATPKDCFSERKGTALFHCHLPEDKAYSVLDHLAEGHGVRQTGRLVGVHTDPVTRAWHAGPDSTPTTLTTPSWLFPSRTHEVQFDEI